MKNFKVCFSTNKLKLNEGKTNYLIFEASHLEENVMVTFLGVIWDNHLVWKEHIISTFLKNCDR